MRWLAVDTIWEVVLTRVASFQVDHVVTQANKMQNNGQLGKYIIRERTKVGNCLTYHESVIRDSTPSLTD